MHSPIKLLHVITTLERGGAEKAVVALAGEQSRIYNEVTILPLKGKLELVDLCVELGVKVDTSMINLSPAMQVLLLKKTISRFHVVHAHLPRAELLLALVSKPNTFFVTRHNSEIFFPRGGPLLSRILSRWVTRKAVTVIAISMIVKSFLLNQRELANKTNCTVIHYGLNLYARSRYQRRQSNTIRIGTVSRLVYQKNIPFLIDLIAELVSLNRNVVLEVVGEGNMRNQIIERIDAKKLASRVYLLGKTSQIEKFLSSLDVFILASRYEGFGLVLLEAMSSGVPVMAPNIEIMREVLGDNHPGLFSPEDLKHSTEVFERLVFQDEYRELCLQMQSDRLPLFSINKYFQAHDDIYRSGINLIA